MVKRLALLLTMAAAVLNWAPAGAQANTGYAETLNWGALPGGSSYDTYLNGTNVATVTAGSYTFTNLDCGTSYTFGVKVHGSAASPIGEVYNTPACVSASPFPLQVSTNGRYMETANGTPWLLVGDSAQSPMGDLSTTNSATFFADRETDGYNAEWVNAVCTGYTVCNADGTTYDGIKPFTVGSGPTTYTIGGESTSPYCGNCNATYFSRLHTMIAQAKADNIEIFLDPLPTDNCDAANNFFSLLTRAGDGTISTTNDDYRYGQYLGQEFGDLNNIIWMSGNDFQCWNTATDFHDVQTVVNGIHNTDPSAMQTIEINSATTSADDTTNLGGLLALDGVYDYGALYAGVQAAYDTETTETKTLPVYMQESSYEGQIVGGAGCMTERLCRLQDWWTMTSGAAGELYGSNYNCPNCGTGNEILNDGSYGIANGFTDANIDSVGTTYLGYQTAFLDAIQWQNLKPDETHAVVTAGEGSCSENQFSTGMGSDNCVTTASDYSGTAGSAHESVTYMPNPSSFSSVTVNLADFSGLVTAQWFDPTNGTYSAVSGSPFTNTGTHAFAQTVNNHAGDKDWVLLLQSS